MKQDASWVAPHIAARGPQSQPMRMEADLGALSEGDRRALDHLVRATHLPVPERFRKALEGLAHEILMAQAVGSHEAARRLIHRYGSPSEIMQALLEGPEGVPLDVDPRYPVEWSGS